MLSYTRPSHALYLVIVIITTGFLLVGLHNMLNIRVIRGDTGGVRREESNNLVCYVHRLYR